MQQCSLCRKCDINGENGSFYIQFNHIAKQFGDDLCSETTCVSWPHFYLKQESFHASCPLIAGFMSLECQDNILFNEISVNETNLHRLIIIYIYIYLCISVHKTYACFRQDTWVSNELIVQALCKEDIRDRPLEISWSPHLLTWYKWDCTMYI